MEEAAQTKEKNAGNPEIEGEKGGWGLTKEEAIAEADDDIDHGVELGDLDSVGDVMNEFKIPHDRDEEEKDRGDGGIELVKILGEGDEGCDD